VSTFSPHAAAISVISFQHPFGTVAFIEMMLNCSFLQSNKQTSDVLVCSRDNW